MKDNCIDCFRIICRGCGWEPDEQQLLLVQTGQLTTCPTCGWQPS